MTTIGCWVFGHKPKSYWQAAVGGRNVRRCQRCDEVLEEENADVKRVMDHAPAHRPTGRPSDQWGKK